MKKRIIPILFILGSIATLSVLLYPVVADFVNSKNQSRAVMGYMEDLAVVDDSSKLAMLEQLPFAKKTASEISAKLRERGYEEVQRFEDRPLPHEVWGA